MVVVKSKHPDLSSGQFRLKSTMSTRCTLMHKEEFPLHGLWVLVNLTVSFSKFGNSCYVLEMTALPSNEIHHCLSEGLLEASLWGF